MILYDCTLITGMIFADDPRRRTSAMCCVGTVICALILHDVAGDLGWQVPPDHLHVACLYL